METRQKSTWLSGDARTIRNVCDCSAAEDSIRAESVGQIEEVDLRCWNVNAKNAANCSASSVISGRGRVRWKHILTMIEADGYSYLN